MKGPVIFDRENNSISFNLPEEAQDYAGQLVKYLKEIFAYESLNTSTVNEMNRSAIEWLKKKGITAKWEYNEEKLDGN